MQEADGFNFMSNHQETKVSSKTCSLDFNIQDKMPLFPLKHMPPTTINIYLAFCGPLSLAINKRKYLAQKDTAQDLHRNNVLENQHFCPESKIIKFSTKSDLQVQGLC